MLRKHLNWRRANGVDTILTDFIVPENIKYIPINRIGLDPEGSPIIYFHVGNLDFKGLLKAATKTTITQYLIHLFQTEIAAMKETSKERGTLMEQFRCVFDFENFTILSATHKPTLDVCLILLQMYDGNYPESLKTAYVINASFAFTILFAVVKPFLSARTYKKVKFYGSDGWLEEFRTFVEKDKVPVFLGGDLRDPDGDPTCKSSFRLGGPIQKEEYLSNRRNSVIVGGKKIVVPRLSKTHILLDVLYPGSMIEWEFQINSRDIGFAVLYKESRNDYQDTEEMIPTQRVYTVGKKESQMFRCEKTGVYILEFDNSFSWWRQKEIYYRATVENPEQSEQ